MIAKSLMMNGYRVGKRLKPYDKIPDSKCPQCGQEVLYKGKKKVLNGTKTEIMWGCCYCEIEGGYWE